MILQGNVLPARRLDLVGSSAKDNRNLGYWTVQHQAIEYNCLLLVISLLVRHYADIRILRYDRDKYVHLISCITGHRCSRSSTADRGRLPRQHAISRSQRTKKQCGIVSLPPSSVLLAQPTRLYHKKGRTQGYEGSSFHCNIRHCHMHGEGDISYSALRETQELLNGPPGTNQVVRTLTWKKSS